ncbi:MFS transporter [Microtetraspora sp. NBRC 13810]|uniref:MFS transporter n=1 Tax=Microtetraspora sp. NBRC 13810 TaxID=3030990 RepID=UPI0024A4526E|nr:MFS transporter [Microtetraspora sp. NBRC 13810]GLW12878.1 MFS transporter [Microtetraspora sp. NBRC 13810]
MSTDAGTPAAPRATRREWLGLAILALPTMLIAMDLTVLHLALPTLTADLRPGNTELLWIVDVYGFLIAGFLITMGAIGDRIGRRRLLLIGAVAFGAASVLSAFATTPEMLIAARALLGIAGSTLMPSTLSLIRIMFQDPKQQGAAIGAWTAFFGLGTVLGPLVGGTFLELFWWGSVFLLGVPIMLLLIAVGPFVLPEYRDESVSHPDLLSAIMSIAGILALIFGLKRIAEDGLRPESGVAVVAGLALAALFLHRQGRLRQPLVDLSLFRNGLFGTALGMLVLATLLSAGSQFFVMQYLQLVRGFAPLEAGLWSLPTTVAVMIGAMAAPGLAGRMKLSTLLAGGLLVTAVGMVVLTRVGDPSDVYVAVAGAAVIGLGLGPMVSLGTGLIVGAAPVERAGAASAMASTGTELGSALGVAVIGSVGFAVYRANLADRLPEGLPAPVVEAAKDTLAAAVNVARELPAAQGSGLLSVARDAFVHGLQTTAIVGAVLAVLLAVAAAVLLRNAAVPGTPPPAAADDMAKPFEKAGN